MIIRQDNRELRSGEFWFDERFLRNSVLAIRTSYCSGQDEIALAAFAGDFRQNPVEGILCRPKIPLANIENPVLRGSIAASLLTPLEKKPRLILLGLDSFDDLFGLRCEGS